MSNASPVPTEEEEETARRIRACVTFCSNVKTDWLEREGEGGLETLLALHVYDVSESNEAAQFEEALYQTKKEEATNV